MSVCKLQFAVSVCSQPGADTLFKYGHWHPGHSSFLDKCGYIKIFTHYTHMIDRHIQFQRIACQTK